MKKNIHVVNQSREFDVTEKFFSITNKKGVIQCGNDVFMRVSGYEPKEIIGKPHNVIRHPDMPRCIFKLFWNYLDSGKVIGAYVKNRAKDGKYYWVYALASAIGNEYISIRVKPSSELFTLVEKLYAELSAHEESFEGTRQQAMESAEELLHEKLKALNFDSYDEFLTVSLKEELHLHNEAVKEAGYTFTHAADKKEAAEIRRLNYVFERLTKLTSLGSHIEETQGCFVNLEKELRMISTNTRYRATRLGMEGQPLNVICDEITRARTDIGTELSRLTADVESIAQALKGATLHSCMGMLQVQMQQEFYQKVIEQKQDDETQVHMFGSLLKDMNTKVHQASNGSLTNFTDEMNNLFGSLDDVDVFVQFLLRMLQVLNFTYVTGRSLSASIGKETKEIDSILEDLLAAANRTSGDLSTLRNLLGDVRGIIAE